MGRRRLGRFLVAVGVALIVGVLAGCGGGESDGGVAASITTTTQPTVPPPGGPSAAIGSRPKNSPQPGSAQEARGVANLVLTGSNALACNPLFVTQHYLGASYGGHQGCVNARRSGGVPDRVYFKSLRIEGDHATAVVVPSGGPSDGERVTVSLVTEARSPGGRPHWAVDGLHADVPVGP